MVVCWQPPAAWSLAVMAPAAWSLTMRQPASLCGTRALGDVTNAPQTYMLDGHQYVIAATGDTLWAFMMY